MHDKTALRRTPIPALCLPPYASSPPASRLAVKLNDRHNDILRLLDQGFLWKEIAGQLGFSASLVNKLGREIFEKLKAHSRAEAVHTWREFGNRRH
jgi:DNA-binding NarL/FixJ family response regulator